MGPGYHANRLPCSPTPTRRHTAPCRGQSFIISPGAGGALRGFEEGLAPAVAFSGSLGVRLGESGFVIAAPISVNLVVGERMVVLRTIGLSVGYQRL